MSSYSTRGSYQQVHLVEIGPDPVRVPVAVQTSLDFFSLG